MSGPQLIETEGVPIKAWMRGVQLEEAARRQLENVARLPFVFHHVAVMPDVHFGHRRDRRQRHPDRGRDHPGGGRRRHRLRHDGGARPRSTREQLPDNLQPLRTAIESGGAARPHRQRRARRSRRVARACRRRRATRVDGAGRRATSAIVDKHPQASARATTSTTSARSAPATTSSRSASTRRDRVWFMLHSGSRGVGNRIGTLLHRAREAGHAARTSRTCRTATSRTSRRAPSTSTTTCEAVELGAALRADEPRS